VSTRLSCGRPVVPEPPPGMRVILPLPWANGSAILASEALAAYIKREADESMRWVSLGRAVSPVVTANR
jgi:hypothetical protein